MRFRGLKSDFYNKLPEYQQDRFYSIVLMISVFLILLCGSLYGAVPGL